MIRQPEFVTGEIFESARVAVAKKKPHLDVSAARLEKWTEGLCAQVMHIGSYDTETATVHTLEQFVSESGYTLDIADGDVQTLRRRHHEIYLSDPRKTAPEKLRTVLRYPIKKR